MKTQLFGHRAKRSKTSEYVPGRPYTSFHEHTEDDGPESYEGKEHVHYEEPIYSKHDIRYPQDEPHMKSHVSREEEHEAEDDYHMPVPKETQRTLPARLKRAHMLMDMPHHDDPKPLLGNLVHNVSKNGMQDTTGEEEEGPNYMQEDTKDHRKKMIVAVMRRKMKKSASR